MKFNNIAITGHSQGIGKGLYDHFINLGYNVIGFSLDNNFNINNKDDINRILDLSSECDLFFNNAYHHYSQAELAKLWHNRHWDDKYFIINTSSILADPLFDVTKNAKWLKKYSEEKYAINEMSWEINQSGSKCKSITIMPGAVDTNFCNPYDTEEDVNGSELYKKIIETNSIITVTNIVTIVDLLLKSINDKNFISSVSILNNY